MTEASPVEPATRWRDEVPASSQYVWLDTPGCPPAPSSVAQALTKAIEESSSGDFSWRAWDGVPQHARKILASWLQIAPERISLLSSTAEAAATVARSLPPGTVVVAADEFRSTLLPWLTLGPRNPVKFVPSRDGVIHTEDLADAIDHQTALVACSEVLSSTGSRLDVSALASAAHEHDARLYVDATQTMGILDWTSLVTQVDYVAVHGYKSMLCPRGAAWLIIDDSHVGGIDPLSPGWRSGPPPHEYFSGDITHSNTAADLDSSPAWLPWIGATASLNLFHSSHAAQVEANCLGLADHFRQEVHDLGLHPVPPDQPSQIVVVPADQLHGLGEILTEQRIRASIFNNRLRVGFHAFNTTTDVETTVRALHSAR